MVSLETSCAVFKFRFRFSNVDKFLYLYQFLLAVLCNCSLSSSLSLWRESEMKLDSIALLETAILKRKTLQVFPRNLFNEAIKPNHGMSTI